MGCDIHLHTEVKINGVWHHYSCPSVRRFYSVFARMANVRNPPGKNHIEPIAEPRGLPSDCSPVTLLSFQRWKEDAHHESWLNAEEIAGLCDFIENKLLLIAKEDWHSWTSENFGYLEGNGWEEFHQYPEERDEIIEDIRFVFWFDN